ncbi:hypothetical protein BV372_01510 [Nostoc sp. T09]|uniref:hypothetical protein n=1 Tax=Nostoc sp. T09 TaxID=1932621 RepID=UPI000A37BEF7|nr:hypothetical protein [Nostoc sp. T09]OUL37664.1 hypothetical protein BV372_01510 [Nostoc sp. T09]
MKSNFKDDQNLLFKWASRGLKYFLLTVLGFVIACVVSHSFGAASLTAMLLSPSLWIWFFRIGVFLFCVFAIAVVIESWS